jgi:molybdate transport system substrate-binding protein
MGKRIGCVAAIATLVIVQTACAYAADITLFSTIGVQGAVEQLIPEFEKSSSNKVTATWSTAAMLTKRIEGGASADAYILTNSAINTLSKEGKIAAGSDVTLANSGIVVAVKAGAPKPDISTPEAFKQTLLNAKSVAYSDPAAGGASGVYFDKLLDRMGIGDQIRAKAKHPPPGGNSANLLVSGEAELAVQQKPEIMYVRGVDVVGDLPGDLNNITVFAAAVSTDSKNADAAKALIKMLHVPASQAVFKEKGLNPL